MLRFRGSHRMMGWMAGLLGMALFFPYSANSQASKPAPDLTGVWDRPPLTTGSSAGASAGAAGGGSAPANPAANRARGVGPDGVPNFGFTADEPPMTPWAAEKYKAARSGPSMKPYDKGSDELDPMISCFPSGPTRIYTIPRPFQIYQFPDHVLIVYEWDHWVRRIYTDGRGHPDGYLTTWMGHSIGKWDGDALVVDTVDINENSWIDTLGHPHSDALHLVERYRRVNHDTLQIEFTFDDPKAYTKPWTGKKTFYLRPPGYEIMEHAICEDWLEMGKKR